jgi:hypothetical protein
MTFGTWRWWGQPHAPAAVTPKRCSWYSFSLGAESSIGPWYGRKEYVIEKSSETTGNRSLGRQTSSAVPQPLRYPRPTNLYWKIIVNTTLRQIIPGQITQRIYLWYVSTLHSRLLLFLPNSLLTANKNRIIQEYFTAHRRDDLFCSFFQFSFVNPTLYEKLSLLLTRNRSKKWYREWRPSSTHSYSRHLMNMSSPFHIRRLYPKRKNWCARGVRKVKIHNA